MKMDGATKALAGVGKSKPKKLSLTEMRLRRGAQGGFIAKHVMQDEEGAEQYGNHPEFPIPTHAELLKHVKTHLPEEAEEIAAEKASKK